MLCRQSGGDGGFGGSVNGYDDSFYPIASKDSSFGNGVARGGISGGPRFSTGYAGASVWTTWPVTGGRGGRPAPTVSPAPASGYDGSRMYIENGTGIGVDMFYGNFGANRTAVPGELVPGGAPVYIVSCACASCSCLMCLRGFSPTVLLTDLASLVRPPYSMHWCRMGSLAAVAAAGASQAVPPVTW